MDLGKLIFTKNDCYKAGGTIIPKGVMVHSTGANNPNLRRYLGPDDGIIGHNDYNNHWNMPGVAKCVHAFIGKDKNGTVRAYQTLPWNHRGWHCGSSGNGTHISMEICEDGLNSKPYFEAVYQKAIELTVHLCKLHGLDPLASGVVISHKEGYTRGIASDHHDIDHWLKLYGKTMDDFRADVSRLMKGELDMTREELEKLIDSRLEAREAACTYKTLEDIPQWAKPTIEPLVASGAILGDGEGLNLRRDLVRALVILMRTRDQ